MFTYNFDLCHLSCCSCACPGDFSPLLPAKLTMTSDTTAKVAVCEGRYHQVKPAFWATEKQKIMLNL